MDQSVNDLHVLPSSDALSGRRIDVVITGSIASVESVRFIRALRRLGADVTPWLSHGGSTFITPLAVTWAAGKEAITGFSGSASHIATGNAVVIAPASSSILAKIARGMTDSHCTALVASALGQQKTLMILPAMHDSLKSAPAMQEHLAKISSWANVSILSAREEEGKQKFPEPEHLADQVAHIMNRPSRPKSPVLVTMGTTRGYLDDVRYISNYSSGKLGSLISEELYRKGYETTVVAGPSEHKPRLATSMRPVLTTTEMLHECEDASAKGLSGGVFCASVLDYEPAEKTLGKLKSGHDNLTISFKPTPKIIEKINLTIQPKIGFKLEVGLTQDGAEAIAKSYIEKYKLTALLVNELSSVSDKKHKAIAFVKNQPPRILTSKNEIAAFIAAHIASHHSD